MKILKEYSSIKTNSCYHNFKVTIPNLQQFYKNENFPKIAVFVKIILKMQIMEEKS